MALAEIMTAVSVAWSVKDKVNETSNDPEGKLKELQKTMPVIMSGGSMVKFLKPLIVEPIAIVSSDLKNEDILESLLRTEVNMFTSLYVKVFEVMTNIYGVDANKALNLLSSSTSINLGKESHGSEPDFLADLFSGNKLLSVESTSVEIKKNEGIDIPDAIVKDVTVEIKNPNTGVVISIPITVKLGVIFATPSEIINVIKPKSTDKTFSERLDAWRSGGISFLDFILAGDIVKEYKKNKIKDENDLMSIVNKDLGSKVTKAIKNEAKGFDNYYNIVIVSADNNKMIEKQIKGSVTKIKYKDRLMEALSALMYTVIDQDYERILIYLKDLESRTDITYKALSKKKDSTSELSDIFKSLLTGRQPF